MFLHVRRTCGMNLSACWPAWTDLGPQLSSTALTWAVPTRRACQAIGPGPIVVNNVSMGLKRFLTPANDSDT